jgi:hypothetical protein
MKWSVGWRGKKDILSSFSCRLSSTRKVSFGESDKYFGKKPRRRLRGEGGREGGTE